MAQDCSSRSSPQKSANFNILLIDGWFKGYTAYPNSKVAPQYPPFRDNDMFAFVIDQGHIVEDGDPNFLSMDPSSMFSQLLEAENQVREGLWANTAWRRIRVERGRIIELGASEWASATDGEIHATGQFDIADERSPHEVAELIRRLGYEPVWKDWDAAFAIAARIA